MPAHTHTRIKDYPDYNNAEVSMEEQWNVISTSVQGFMAELGAFLPNLLAAIVILVVGWLLSKALYWAVVHGLKAIRFNVITEGARLDDFLKKGGIKKSTIEVIGQLVYWLAILVTVLTAFNSLGLTVVSEMFSRIIQFVPNVIVAVLILTIGLYFARFVENVVTAYSLNIGLVDAALIGRLARWSITVFVFIVALGQMNIADRILYPAFITLLAGVALAFGLAFGLGGQKWAQDQLDKWNKKSK
jgi:hypothetical protein